ncbi:hypothetical protein ACGFNU_46365 [Spirillospora sp. NPDC048911]|uniref:hypothetical protein n=1 Tax=Spirillospora sp. NPDC048911 TaxID=3364527 RepID=UPI0037102D22
MPERCARTLLDALPGGATHEEKRRSLVDVGLPGNFLYLPSGTHLPGTRDSGHAGAGEAWGSA